ncbi:MAG TPA: hypothetical protein VMB48_08330 [Steroidobacteraceae bacterium]|nr:hypothetical protein [Steroidobacteraceae bacterium]
MGSVVHRENIGAALLQVTAYPKLRGGATWFEAVVRLPNGQQISCRDTGEDLYPSLSAAVAAGRLWAGRTQDPTFP